MLSKQVLQQLSLVINLHCMNKCYFTIYIILEIPIKNIPINLIQYKNEITIYIECEFCKTGICNGLSLFILNELFLSIMK